MELVTIRHKRSFGHLAKLRLKKSGFLIAMIIPAIAFYAIFCYVPMYGVLMAFQKYYPKLGIFGSKWIGFDNFKVIFEDPYFWTVLLNTIKIGTIKIVLAFVGAVTTALLLNELRMRRVKKVIQIIVTFPHFLSWVIIAGFVSSLFTTSGSINDLIYVLGGERVMFMANGNFFLGLIFGADIWKEAGWGSIVYLATMAGIPQDQYEAADIDGATRLQKIWHVTLPGIKSVAILLLIMSVGGVLSAGFDQIFNLYNPLVYEKADILDTYIYRETFQSYRNPGIGTAVGLFKSVVSFILVIATDRIAKACGERGII
ncbi:MAG: sugar ABC transporter permease [Bacilli bacterium]|nr:sugar ABC transporter permease [Bacilli bacterium]